MLTISRRCVPFTPFEKDLATAVVTLVSATGVYAPGQERCPTEDPGDISYRASGGDAHVGALRVAPHHYRHSQADAEPYIIFPLPPLHELPEPGRYAGVN